MRNSGLFVVTVLLGIVDTLCVTKVILPHGAFKFDWCKVQDNQVYQITFLLWACYSGRVACIIIMLNNENSVKKTNC